MGLCLMIGLISSAVSLGFYFVRRHKPLFYFGITTLLSYLVFGFANHDPQYVFDIRGQPILFRLLHFFTGLALYFYAKSIRSALPHNTYVHWTALQIVLVLSLLARIVAIITIGESWIRVSAFITAVFFVLSVAYGAAYPGTTKSTKMIRAGCCLFSAGLSFYPLTRSGVLPPIEVDTYAAFLVLGTLAVSSSLWLFGLLELAKELLEDAERAARKDVAGAMLQLRDLMNSPLQTLEFSMALLRETPEDRDEILQRVENALAQMRDINMALTLFEKDVDWNQKKSFFKNSLHQVGDQKPT